MGRTIVFTGATGTIGKSLVPLLVDRGDSVIALVRDIDKGRRLFRNSVTLLRWSSERQAGEWADAIDGSDVVVHLAGTSLATRWTPNAIKAIRESRIMGSRHLVDAIAQVKRKPSAFISASGIAYYGTDTSKTFNESSPPGNDFLAGVAVAWESEAVRARSFGLRVPLVRTAVVLDRDNGALPQLLLPFRLFVGGHIGSGRQPFAWIHRQDVVDLYLRVIDHPTFDGPINAVAPQLIDNRRFSRAIGRAIGRPAFMRIPEIAVWIRIGRKAAVTVTEGQWVVSERAAELGFRYRYTDIDAALRDLIGGR